MCEQVNKTRILIGITTAETVSHETMQSIYNLVIPENVETVLRVVHAYNVADGRNNFIFRCSYCRASQIPCIHCTRNFHVCNISGKK